MASIEVTIPNWSKFNPRSDRANYSWFRLDNNFFHDQSVFGLTPKDKLTYIFVLCELSKKNKECARVDLEYAAAMLRLNEAECIESLISLQKSGLIKTSLAGVKPASRRRKAGKEPSLLPATYERTNVRTNVRAAAISEEPVNEPETDDDQKTILPFVDESQFEEIFRCYPKRKGDQRKQVGFKKLQKLSKEDLAQFRIAVKNYDAYCRYQEIAPEFIKQFGTFANEVWREWIVIDHAISRWDEVCREIFLTKPPRPGLV